MARATSLVSKIRSDLTAGRLQPGERLVEADLMARYGATRRSVRDALAELDKEGLVVRAANRGAAVRKISLEEAVEITQVRAVLEGLLASEAAANATDAEKAKLRDIVDRMRDAARDEPVSAFPALYREYHQTLRGISGHGTAAELVQLLRNRNAQHQFRTALMPGRVEASLVEHERIADAIVAGDSEAAAEAMHDHLEAVERSLREWHDGGLIA